MVRGAYLVDVVGHCGECHTPRNRIGGLLGRAYLAGSEEEPEPGPNITPHADGADGWSIDDWLTFLEIGMKPDAEFVGGEMGRVVEEGTAILSEADRRAMARWLVDGVAPRANR